MLPKNLIPRKETLDPYFLPIIVVLVGLSAFGLGRLSAAGESAPLVQNNEAPYSANFVASKSGASYYLPSCGGVAKIKEENRVWFATVAEAQAAGYTAAINCPGL